MVRLVNIGYSNCVSAGRIVAVVSPDAAPIKRLIQDAKDDNKCIDATCGRRMRAVLIMDSNHVILSSVKPSTVGQRLEQEDEEEE